MTKQKKPEKPRDCWRTPRWIVREAASYCGGEFGLDVAADADNAVCRAIDDEHYDRTRDALSLPRWNSLALRPLPGWLRRLGCGEQDAAGPVTAGDRLSSDHSPLHGGVYQGLVSLGAVDLDGPVLVGGDLLRRGHIRPIIHTSDASANKSTKAGLTDRCMGRRMGL